MIEFFPTHIENLTSKIIKINDTIFVEPIDSELLKIMHQSGKSDNVSPFYPLSYDIIQYEDSLREIYLKSNYVFKIDNKNSEIVDVINFAFYIYSEFKNFLNFSIIKNNRIARLDKLCSERKFIQRDDLFPNIIERDFLYGGQSNTITEEQLQNIIKFIKKHKEYISNDRKRFIIQRIKNYNKIRKDSQVTLPFRFIEIVSILEGIISHLGKDSLSKKFKDSFSYLLNKYYKYDIKMLRSEFQAFYAIRSSLVHDGNIDWTAQELTKYKKQINGFDNYSKTMFFFEKLEKYIKQILIIYFIKDIEFCCIIMEEK